MGGAPSQGLVYAVDDDVVLKLPFQYALPDRIDGDGIFYISHALRSFITLEREQATYGALASLPHPNTARRLESTSSSCLFMARLQPIDEVWNKSNTVARHQRVRELVDAISWLEHLGFVHGDQAARSLGVDSSNRLKVFAFGSTTKKDHFDYASDVKDDRSGLATCLHYLLSGDDPLENLTSVEKVRQMKRDLLEGRGIIAEGAEPLASIIQDGWTGRAASKKFCQIKDEVLNILPPEKAENKTEIPRES